MVSIISQYSIIVYPATGDSFMAYRFIGKVVTTVLAGFTR